VTRTNQIRERFPPKWLPVRRRKRANYKYPGHFRDSKKSQNALALWIGAYSALCFGTTGSATAASDTALALRGLQRFEIVIEDVSQNAMQCGIARERLETSVRSIVGQSRMTVVDNLPEATIYLNVSVLSDCTTRVTLEVFTGVTVEKTGQRTVATIWNDGILGRGADPAVQVASIIDDLTRGLVKDWNSANPVPN